MIAHPLTLYDSQAKAPYYSGQDLLGDFSSYARGFSQCSDREPHSSGKPVSRQGAT